MHVELGLGNLLDCKMLKQQTGHIISYASELVTQQTIPEPAVRGIIIDFLKTFDIEISSVMALSSAKAMGIPHDRAMNVASAVLFVRTASMLHNLVNEPDLVGAAAATRSIDKLLILAGDLLIAQATELIADYGTPFSVVRLGHGFVRLLESNARLPTLSPSPRTAGQYSFWRSHLSPCALHCFVFPL